MGSSLFGLAPSEGEGLGVSARIGSKTSLTVRSVMIF